LGALSLTFALLFATGETDPAHTCVFKGQLKLQSIKGAPMVPVGLAVVYVKWVSRKVSNHRPKVLQVVQKGREFEPRLLVVVEHDAVKFVNEDNEEHSVFSHDLTNGFDMPRSTRGETGVHTFSREGGVHVQCDIHEWMRSDMLVVQNPFYAYPDKEGSWRIDPLPPGEYEIGAWEINGATVETKKLKCDGETTVQMPLLRQAEDPQHVRKDGSPYPEYKH
jgi:plastocyanin